MAINKIKIAVHKHPGFKLIKISNICKMQKTFEAILVDDEVSARNILSNLILNYCPQIKIVDKCENVEQATISINQHKPDLVFLDIEMPNYAGYEITSFFKTIDFEIIFITAYDHYAVKAFQVSAVDYVLKPIDISRLKEAVNKFIAKQHIKDSSLNYELLIESLKADKINRIIIPYQGDQKIIILEDIIALEANEAYCFIHTIGPKYIVSKNLKHFENLFNKNTNFFRTHKSWIINLDFLKNYSKTKLILKLDQHIHAKLSKYKKVQFETILAEL